MVLYKINEGIKMTKQNNNNTEQNIAITILCATLWMIFSCYLLSLPVNAQPLTDIESFALCNEVTDLE
jgi:hypothetical protein